MYCMAFVTYWKGRLSKNFGYSRRLQYSVAMRLHALSVLNNAWNKRKQPSETCPNDITVLWTVNTLVLRNVGQNNALPIGLPSPRLFEKDCVTIGNDVTRTEASFRQVTQATDSSAVCVCHSNYSASLCGVQTSATVGTLILRRVRFKTSFPWVTKDYIEYKDDRHNKEKKSSVKQESTRVPIL
jgi:hypothetical protein